MNICDLHKYTQLLILVYGCIPKPCFCKQDMSNKYVSNVNSVLRYVEKYAWTCDIVATYFHISYMRCLLLQQ